MHRAVLVLMISPLASFSDSTLEDTRTVFLVSLLVLVYGVVVVVVVVVVVCDDNDG